MKEYITKRVHELYWKEDINCARTALVCLSELFEIAIERQAIWSAVGLHGAGGYRAQCGLVEGSLMFIGIYLHTIGQTEDEIVSACYNFASAFDREFGSSFFTGGGGGFQSAIVCPVRISTASTKPYSLTFIR